MYSNLERAQTSEHGYKASCTVLNFDLQAIQFLLVCIGLEDTTSCKPLLPCYYLSFLEIYISKKALIALGSGSWTLSPILERRSAVLLLLLLPHAQDSETGWTGELWSRHVLLILEN